MISCVSTSITDSTLLKRYLQFEDLMMAQLNGSKHVVL
jgi:hypothetical protein